MGSYVVQVLEASGPGGDKEIPFEFCDLGELLGCVARIHPDTLTSVTNLSKTDPFYSVPEGALLRDVLSILAGGAHRVAVMDKATGRAKHILSQSAVLKHLRGVGWDRDFSRGCSRSGLTCWACVLLVLTSPPQGS